MIKNSLITAFAIFMFHNLPVFMFHNLAFADQGLNPISLPKLNLNPQQISVSGISSGAAMASQLMATIPEQITAAGLFAGPVWGCALGSADRAQELCMKTPDKLNLQELTTLLEGNSENQFGDPLRLSQTKLYLWHGSRDSRVSPYQLTLQNSFWGKYIPAKNIHSDGYHAFEHLLPTAEVGSTCQVAGHPFIGKCGFAALDRMFDFFESKSYQATSGNSSTPLKVVHFKQSDYLETGALMHKEGYIYIPKACEINPSTGTATTPCKLHIAFHGCKQSPEFVDKQYAENTGYLAAAEKHNYVILFPTSSSSKDNPFGCWDWWGYTGPGYLKKSSPQIKSIVNMIQALTK